MKRFTSSLFLATLAFAQAPLKTESAFRKVIRNGPYFTLLIDPTTSSCAQSMATILRPALRMVARLITLMARLWSWKLTPL